MESVVETTSRTVGESRCFGAEVQTQSKYNLVQKRKRSAELVEVTEAIRDLRGAAAAAGFASTLQNSEKLDELIQEMRKNHEDLEFSSTTRSAVNTDVVSRFDLVTNRTTSSEASQEIRAQADALTTREERRHGSDDGATPSNPEQQGKSNGFRKVSEVIVGGDEFMEKVKKLLLSYENSKWVGVWSMGGAGKTLTAGRVCNDPDIRRHFIGGIFWLTIGAGRSPLSLLSLLYTEITKRTSKWETDEDLKEQVESKLGDHVLLVLDDVWSLAVLLSLDVLHHHGSKIFVTTRDQSLLDSVSAEKLQLPMLSPERSWELFCWHAFGGENNVPRVVEKHAREVANECKGLPLALKVIGATMRGKKDPRLWKINLQRLQHAYIISQEHEKQLLQRLQVSIDDLGQLDKRLIDCFYYFAAFPEDHEVRLSDVLGLWVGEGMVRGNSALSPEDEAYLLLGHLIARSLIELGSSRSHSLVYKVHDVLRDLARHNLQNNLKPIERLCLYQPGLQLTRFPEDWKYSASHPQTSTASNSFTFPSVQRMSLMYNDLAELPSEKLIAPHLLVFLVGNNNRIERVPKNFFVGLPHLKVLDLRSTAITKLPSEALRNLKDLVLLDLSGCEKLQKIPNSVKDLQNLEELRLSGCKDLQAIPRGACLLKNLQVLLMAEAKVWDHGESKRSLLDLRPSWISKGVATLHDVSYLNSLINLSVSSGELTDFLIDFKSLKMLRHLYVDFAELLSFPDPSELKELESLTLRCDELTELPEGITALSNLTRLEFNGCQSLSSLPELDKLPLLKHLDLSYCDQLQVLPESFGYEGSFPSLEELKMDSCEKIVFPNLNPGAMSQLSALSLCGWDQLQQLPVCLQVLENLRGLDLSFCENLETLEPAFDSNSFPCLEHLRLKDTSALTQLPGFLAAKPKLMKLDLVGCPAGDPLPQEFQNVERLEILTEDFKV